MTARDLARFGQLYLQNGQWCGRQVIPARTAAHGLEEPGHDLFVVQEAKLVIAQPGERMDEAQFEELVRRIRSAVQVVSSATNSATLSKRSSAFFDSAR